MYTAISSSAVKRRAGRWIFISLSGLGRRQCYYTNDFPGEFAHIVEVERAGMITNKVR